MVISIDAEKAFDKIQHHSQRKLSSNQEYEQSHLNKVKITYDKPTANIILSGERLKAFSSKKEQDKEAHSHHLHLTQY